MTAAQLAYFKGVESIHLERGYYPVDDARRAIAQMIALFPRVEHVSFTTTCGVFPATAVPHFVNSVQATESLTSQSMGRVILCRIEYMMQLSIRIKLIMVDLQICKVW
jgi:hypothetical protein